MAGLWEVLYTLLLARHDAYHHAIGLLHGFAADAGEVAYAAVYIFVNDTLDASHRAVLHGQHGREHGGRNTAR